MFCSQCGTKMEDSMRFCPKCGTPAAVPAQPEAVPEEPAASAQPEAPAAAQPAQNEQPPAQQPQPPAEQTRVPAEAQIHSSRQLPADYRAINIMEYGSHGWSYLYPNIDENGRIVADAADHGIPAPIIARSITVKKQPKGTNAYQPSLQVKDVVLEVYVTDARIIFQCDKYDKGGYWYGGLTALALTAVERGIASARTKGKTLAGHVRYEWLKHLMYVRKQGVLSDEQMRIVYKDKAGTQWQIDVVLDKHVDSSAVANDIMHRASALRKSMRDEKGEIDDASRDWFTQHAHPSARIPHTDEKNTFSYIVFPQNYLAPAGEGLNPDWTE